MPISLSWDSNNQDVMCATLEGRWTTPELSQLWSDGEMLLDSIEHTANFIMIFDNAAQVPGSVTTVFNQARMFFEHHNMGNIMVVRASLMVKTFAGAFLRMWPHLGSRIHFVNTLDAAYEHLAANRMEVQGE